MSPNDETMGISAATHRDLYCFHFVAIGSGREPVMEDDRAELIRQSESIWNMLPLIELLFHPASHFAGIAKFAEVGFDSSVPFGSLEIVVVIAIESNKNDVGILFL